MSYPTSNDLAPNAFVIRLETNQMVSPDSFGSMLREIDRLAHLKSALGPYTELRIADVGTGSIWAHIVAGLDISANIATIGGFVLLLEERIWRKSGGLAEVIATMAIDDSVVEAKIVTRDRTIEISTNDLPARKTIESKRASAAAGVPYKTVGRGGYGRDYGRDYGGTPAEAPTEEYRQALSESAQVSDRVEAELIPAQIRSRGGIGFGGSGDIRASRFYVGTFHRGKNEEDPPIFITEQEETYSVELSNHHEMDIEDLAFGQRVVVRGEIDAENRWIMVFEVMVLSPG